MKHHTTQIFFGFSMRTSTNLFFPNESLESRFTQVYITWIGTVTVISRLFLRIKTISNLIFEYYYFCRFETGWPSILFLQTFQLLYLYAHILVHITQFGKIVWDFYVKQSIADLSTSFPFHPPLKIESHNNRSNFKSLG